MTNAQTPEWLTVAEIAAELRLSKVHVYRLIERGDLPAFSFGDRAFRVRRDDFDAFVTASRIDGAS